MRLFYDDSGRIYKAEKAKNPSHAECLNPLAEMLQAASDEPKTREELINIFQHPEFKLASPKEETGGAT